MTEMAEAAADGITPRIIASDEHLGVSDGTAGLLLALLALYRETGNRKWLTKAGICGRHLLHKTSGERMRRQNLEEEMRSGFSGDMAGIAAALLRLWMLEPDPDYLVLVRSELNHIADCAKANRRLSFAAIRCGSAPGIILSLAYYWSLFHDAEYYEIIERTMEAVTATGNQGIDTLGCGNAGNIDDGLPVLSFSSC